MSSTPNNGNVSANANFIVLNSTNSLQWLRQCSTRGSINNRDRWQWRQEQRQWHASGVSACPSQLECQRMLNEQADSGERVMLPPLHPPHNALHSVSYLPHPCRETSISDISLTHTSSTVATLNDLDLTVAGVAVGRGCIRACHHPTIERQVARSIGILNLYRKRIAETQ